MSAELIPLKKGQHVVTYVPKVTTDLPFFNLTQRKKGISSRIKFEGKDTYGNPINWEVRHNTDDDIGYAGVLAHEVWYLVIKPAIDVSMKQSGKIPTIIPLGGIRECLRMVGWTAGGHQANDFIRALTQIAFAGIIADLWFPTGETDTDGKPKFKQLKGRFSRMSVYAIGEQHLTDEEIKNASFEFDLEDVVYIKLDPFETKLLEAQSESQKLIDNEYMFSVKPVARRWYELMAGKVFGAVLYKKLYFKIKYSEYLKHHHTLKRFYTPKAVNRQIRQVIEDHLKNNFVTKFESRKLIEEDREPDFEIKFYIGEEAKNSISRIRGYLATNNRKKEIEVKKANKSPEIGHSHENRSDIPNSSKNALTSENLQPQSILESREALALLDTVTEEHRETMRTLMFEYGVSAHKAYTLATEKFDECRKQIEAIEFRDVKMSNKAGFIIKAIEESYSLPEIYLEKQQEEKNREVLKAKRELTRQCSLCDDSGMREIERFDDFYNRTISQYKKCSHDPEVESKFKTKER